MCWILLSLNRWKILSKIAAMHYWPRKVYTDQFVVSWSAPSLFVQQADSTQESMSEKKKKQADSTQARGKKLELVIS